MGSRDSTHVAFEGKKIETSIYSYISGFVSSSEIRWQLRSTSESSELISADQSLSCPLAFGVGRKQTTPLGRSILAKTWAMQRHQWEIAVAQAWTYRLCYN